MLLNFSINDRLNHKEMGYDENNISRKFIIGLCKRKETAALKIKTAVS